MQKLAFEDVTALGTDLQDLDAELAGRELDAGARSDYQRALDAYEAAKTAADRLTEPETSATSPRSSRTVATPSPACAPGWPVSRCRRAARRASSTRATVSRWPTSSGPRPAAPRGRSRPARLDAERVHAGAEPDTRQVMVGAQRMPYYEGGPAYAPYAAGYFGGGMNMLFGGLLIGSMLGGGFGFGGGHDGGGDGGDGGGGDGGGAGGGGDVGGGDGGGFDFGGDFGGFDF